MPEETHTFKLQSVWNGNSDGEGTASGDGWSVAYGVPAALGGKSGRAKPDGLLVSPVVSSYCITLALLAERKRLPLERIEMSAEGVVERQLGGTLKFSAIDLSPVLIAPSADEAQVR